MRFAFFGDVVGRSGRDGLAEHLPGLRRRLGLEFVIVNAENAAAGFGITESTAPARKVISAVMPAGILRSALGIATSMRKVRVCAVASRLM